MVAIVEPLPLTPAHHAVAAAGGDPGVMRMATSPFAPEHPIPRAGNARIVPEGVAITLGAVITTPFATWGAIKPPPTPPRLSRFARCNLPSLPSVATKCDPPMSKGSAPAVPTSVSPASRSFQFAGA